MKKSFVLGIFLSILISIPTFFRMLRPGIYSMQDFHFFRLVEFNKCFNDLQIPCRWSQEAGLGYGEPLFNFYGQIPYVFGQFLNSFGFSLIDSLKGVFIFSLIGSSISMFLLSKHLFKNNLASVVTTSLYTLAPYRAVDVWVRGALPEALSFVFFPLIILFFERYIEAKNKMDLLFLSVFISLLVLTHNLSVVLFAPFMLCWVFYRLIILKKIKFFPSIIIAGLFSILLSSFYILPVIFESQFVNLESTTQGYFNFRGHFVGLAQLFTSFYWGYGGSVFGSEDGLNLSVGILQWTIPLFALGYFLFTKRINKNKNFLILMLIGWFYLFLTHNKSTFIWTSLDFMKYIQFPWRFLGVAIFTLSLASGYFFASIKKLIFVALVVIMLLIININFFKEDIWNNVTDSDLTTGNAWIDQTRASIGDYWPNFGGVIPNDYAPVEIENIRLSNKSSNVSIFEILKIQSRDSYELPINYFPGWQGYYKSMKIDTLISENGRILIENIPDDAQLITVKFEDTQVRKTGNFISFVSLLILVSLFIKFKKQKNEY